MTVKREEEQAEIDKDQEEENYNFGIFGMDMAGMSSGVMWIYIGVIGSVLIGAFVWGFKQLNNSSLPSNKKKKQKVKKQK
jgi:hypothetical protein